MRRGVSHTQGELYAQRCLSHTGRALCAEGYTPKEDLYAQRGTPLRRRASLYAQRPLSLSKGTASSMRRGFSP